MGSPTKLIVGRWPHPIGTKVVLSEKIHRQSIYVRGLSRTGKSTLLGNLALQFNALGEGVAVLDHKDGLLARELAQRADITRLVYVAPGTTYFDHKAHHWGLNIMEKTSHHRTELSQRIENVLSMMERLDRAAYEVNTNIFLNLNTAVRLVMHEARPNLQLVRQALTAKPYRQYLVHRFGEALNTEVADHFINLDADTSPYGRQQSMLPTIARLREILTPEELQFMVVQERTTLKLQEWLEAGKLVVIDCISGRDGQLGLSQGTARLIANLIMTQLMHFAFSRVIDPDDPWEGKTRAVRLIVDEFDQLAGRNFPDLISKTGSFRVLPVLAHQTERQLNQDRKLAQEVTASPIQLFFSASDADVPKGADPTQQPAKYEADLKLLNDSLPFGLLDRRQTRRIRLLDWMNPRIEGQLDAAIEAQRPFVTPERVIRERMKDTSYAQPDDLSNFSQGRTKAPKTGTGRTPKPTPPGRALAPSRPARTPDAADIGQIPEIDAESDLPPYIPHRKVQ